MIIWVTGASSGLGAYTARELARRGHTVIAGARSFPGGMQDGMHTLPLDVTKAESIAAFADAAREIAPGVDALVCCAAVLQLSPCEETSPEEYARVLDTNFLGMVRMAGQVLPTMRAQKHGKLMLFSSINGLLGVPFQSAYTASKHAVEGWAECLELETRDYGIQVCLVEPGDHRGGAQHTRGRQIRQDSPYRKRWQDAVDIIAHDEATGSSPEKLAVKAANALERRCMPERLRVAKPDQHLAVYLHDVLPALFGKIIGSYYQKRG